VNFGIFACVFRELRANSLLCDQVDFFLISGGTGPNPRSWSCRCSFGPVCTWTTRCNEVRVPRDAGEPLHLHRLVAEFQLEGVDGHGGLSAQHVVELWPASLPSLHTARKQARKESASDPMNRAVLDMVEAKRRERKGRRGPPHQASSSRAEDVGAEGSAPREQWRESTGGPSHARCAVAGARVGCRRHCAPMSGSGER
jgi:hypothetical protein